MATPYSRDFYEAQRGESLASARALLPTLLQLLAPAFTVRSAVDVGAGVGTWLAVLAQFGVEDLLGVEGLWVLDMDPLVDRRHYRVMDLARPEPVARRFDLALCLEVAEHIALSAAEGFIAFVTELSDVVLFSAAIPHQGGTHHVNEQWPRYWAELFARRGYSPYDVLRPMLWNDERIGTVYRQNVVLYVGGDARAALHQHLSGHGWPLGDDGPLAVVHPDFYLREAALAQRPTLGTIFRSLPRSLAASLAFRLGRRRHAGGGRPD